VRARFSTTRFSARLFVLWALLIGTLVSGCPLLCDAEANPAKNVLLLYSFSDRTVYDPADSLKSAIRKRVAGQVDFYVEYLESQRFENPKYEQNLAEALRDTYSGKRLDLVVAFSYPALAFAVEHRQLMFPGVPIIFADVNAVRFEARPVWPGVTGITVNTDVRGTIELALHLHPDATTVAVITNNSAFERYWLGRVNRELGRYQGRVREVDLVGPANADLLAKVAGLPPHSIALFQLAPQDSSQPVISVYDTLAAVGQRLPTYCIFPTLCLNHGGIGGASSDEKEQSAGAAELARRILSGESPDSIPVMQGSAAKNVVDWRQLQRWQIPESALPPGAVVLYREPTFWQRGKNYIVAAGVLILVQGLLIVGLLMQRARKRKAEAVLRESEERFRVMADSTPSLIWMCDKAGKVTYLNDRRLVFTGADLSAGYGDTWTAYVHPDDLQSVLDSLSQALAKREPFSKEYRLRRNDGAYRWMFDVASPRKNGDGSFAGLIGSAVDVSDQKLAQKALENVSGQLIEAQEQERSRIARDLHDDICQRLSLLSMELQQANRNGAPPSTKKHLEEIRQRCADITSDIQSLSHQLHSSKLEYLGVVAAVRGFCKEFAQQNDVSVNFRDESVPRRLPKDISLCLFRVAQEALHNAAKYSETDQLSVELRGTAQEIQLTVSDAGVGFDVEAAKRNRGLGLVSMQERVNLVRGRFFVQSEPGAGTKVTAIVPVGSGSSTLPTEEEREKAATAKGAA